jgi:hypothetical protein
LYRWATGIVMPGGGFVSLPIELAIG